MAAERKLLRTSCARKVRLLVQFQYKLDISVGIARSMLPKTFRKRVQTEVFAEPDQDVGSARVDLVHTPDLASFLIHNRLVDRQRIDPDEHRQWRPVGSCTFALTTPEK